MRDFSIPPIVFDRLSAPIFLATVGSDRHYSSSCRTERIGERTAILILDRLIESISGMQLVKFDDPNRTINRNRFSKHFDSLDLV
jgi:hypothetical protein